MMHFGAKPQDLHFNPLHTEVSTLRRPENNLLNGFHQDHFAACHERLKPSNRVPTALTGRPRNYRPTIDPRPNFIHPLVHGRAHVPTRKATTHVVPSKSRHHKPRTTAPHEQKASLHDRTTRPVRTHDHTVPTRKASSLVRPEHSSLYHPPAEPDDEREISRPRSTRCADSRS
ncbi:unnamed protein product [Microthlaspi erraticum]|uniref:Uncharacterized protein n=1 Tax=Microthlaspi erraticum TaxID=1685480 RepID=A0A6D2I747_9BRAS|nr:unnamed protein product [Microthlaspi erraticum]